MSIPPTTRALTYRGPSAPPRVKVEPLPKQIPPGSILVHVLATSINPCDTQLMNSTLIAFTNRAEKGVGRDFSGTIVASEATGWDVGEEVYGMMLDPTGVGTLRDYLIVNTSRHPIAKKPIQVSHDQAASIPLVALTAYSCMEWLPDRPKRVVVLGASGGTGVWCVQLAKQIYNCEVIAVCSGKNADFVKDLGADSVVDYTKGPVSSALLDLAKANAKFDLIIDCVGGTEHFPYLNQLLPPDGGYVSIVGDKTDRVTMGGPPTYLMNPKMIFRRVKGWIVGPWYGCIFLTPNSQWLEDTNAFLETGKIKAVLDSVYEDGLGESEGWKKAFEKMDSARARGKVVIKI